jgi:hypothetical protein
MSENVRQLQLQQIAEAIKNAGFLVFIRGDESARFVFAENGGRAIEVYHGKVAFCVECFLPEEEFSSVELRGISNEIATQRAIEWLKLG